MLVSLLFTLTFACLTCRGNDLPGHNMPFGWGNTIPIEEMEGSPSVKEFFEKYVRPGRPLVMRGANKIWPAFKNWQTDDYFRAVAPKEPFMIAMNKKNNRPDDASRFMNFREFLDRYNTSQRRMVEFTPFFLRPDVLIPHSLDCPAITQGEILMGNKMWFGANYSASVVHKDAADNINCLVYGIKNYTMVDLEYGKHVWLDRPDGLYSTMNSDKVDFDKYPGMEKVQYQISELHAGDCVFVPYKWIHQVRSYGRNLAVNIWWNHWKIDEIDVDKCPDTRDKTPISINQARFHGWTDFQSRDSGIREHVLDLMTMTRENLSLYRFALLFTLGLEAADDDADGVDPDIWDALNSAHAIIDQNKDGGASAAEFDSLPDEKQKQVINLIRFVLNAANERAGIDQEIEKEEMKIRRYGHEMPTEENLVNQEIPVKVESLKSSHHIDL